MGELEAVVRRILVYTGPDGLRVAGDIEVWLVGRFVDAFANNSLWP